METDRFIVTADGREHHCETEEEVSSVVERYQMEHRDDPDLSGISVLRLRGEGADDADPVPPQRFLPQQLP